MKSTIIFVMYTCKQNLYFVFKHIRYKDISHLTTSPHKDRDLQSIFAEFFLNIGTTDVPFSSAGKEVTPRNIFEIASGQTGMVSHMTALHTKALPTALSQSSHRLPQD